MNIFKTLASGSGRINEPNVSAFLGYLLNPKEDHGLGDAFLKRFLEPLLAGNDNLEFMRNRNLSIHSNFEFEVLLEQAFKDNDSKDDESTQVVDIIILCYEKKSQQGRFLAKDIIKQKKEGKSNLRQIFLIENKINANSVTEWQLEKQFRQTINELKKEFTTKEIAEFKIDKLEDLISVIFVTPNNTECQKEFVRFGKANKTENKIHLFWNKKDDSNSISKMIKSIIEKESAPIDAYCKYTLQAFLEFIENGFKSTIEEEREEKGKDFSKYRFENTPYPKNRLVEAVITKYITDNPNTTLSELQHIFPKQLTGDRKKECVLDAKEAKKDGYYFTKDNELITLENGEIIAVCSWWAIDNLPNFITQAEKLGYKIEKSDQ